MRYVLTLIALLTAPPVMAERGDYGYVTLNGLARDIWPQVPNLGAWRAMVCNVNGPDGFLSVRSGPGTDFKVVRSFNRLAVIELDASERRGRWVRVTGAFRHMTPEGRPTSQRNLPVQGWVHNGYLCAFIA
ncbi:SH3 domain-containing protein [Sulfitobacter sp. F26169L]|uniref:SH3 domain-containing protein n=1 Tax=Sulfitobacter sp. F26169L TaxID=2996015 RepID=UPI002260EDF1|nr:SH3 domain-containing protein [Sulfitobacter sp. F26169L]MCX7566432.1 SH3 domain-containing protein [Sulfitobacter sp. F26169L]